MMNLQTSVRVFLCAEPCDMRRGFYRLAEMARHMINEDPMSGHLFVFRNRRGNRLKVLYWDRNGFAVWYKALERGQFFFPEKGLRDGKEISPAAFQLILGGAVKKPQKSVREA